jgi:hypothetical protein
MRLEAPGVLRQALSLITDLGATVELVPDGGEPGDPIPLERGADGVSFSGFIEAAPGRYTIEIAFTGLFAGRSDRIFLGRWVSDLFTVVEGSAASPTFTRPFDTIGRPSDGGDTDGDGLGLIDELFFGANPAMPDTDGDGVADGEDCDPTDATSTYRIIGTLEDCDGDGVLRPILPYKAGGPDCDDRDPSVRPGATDVCDDRVDQDCNPETCPLDDTEGPSIAILDPRPSETVGCHRRVRARIADPAGVDVTEVLFVDGSTPPVVAATIPMRPDGSDEYITNQFDIATSFWLEDGIQRYQVRARDARGNTSLAASDLVFALAVPAVTMTPPAVGSIAAPVDVGVTASSRFDIATIELMRAPWPAGGEVDRTQEAPIGSISGSEASFRLDPGALPNGRHAIYAVVTDVYGNRNKPSATFTPELAGGALATDADFLCIFASGDLNVPVREVIVGPTTIPPGNEPAKMRDHLDEAIALATQRDPNARLVEVRGWGIEPDGFIPLDQAAGGEGKWWRYEFFNMAAARHIEVTWYTATDSTSNPEVVVEENYAFTPDPIMNAAGLLDSDTVIAAYVADACPALTGSEADSIRYESDLPFSSADVVRVDVGMVTYKATAVAPLTEIWGCN